MKDKGQSFGTTGDIGTWILELGTFFSFPSPKITLNHGKSRLITLDKGGVVLSSFSSSPSKSLSFLCLFCSFSGECCASNKLGAVDLGLWTSFKNQAVFFLPLP